MEEFEESKHVTVLYGSTVWGHPCVGCSDSKPDSKRGAKDEIGSNFENQVGICYDVTVNSLLISRDPRASHA